MHLLWPKRIQQARSKPAMGRGDGRDDDDKCEEAEATVVPASRTFCRGNTGQHRPRAMRLIGSAPCQVTTRTVPLPQQSHVCTPGMT